MARNPESYRANKKSRHYRQGLRRRKILAMMRIKRHIEREQREAALAGAGRKMHEVATVGSEVRYVTLTNV